MKTIIAKLRSRLNEVARYRRVFGSTEPPARPVLV